VASVEIIGLDRLLIRIKQIQDNLNPVVEAELKEMAEAIRDLAKIFVPIETGSLQKSIRLQSHTKSGGLHSIGVSAGGYVTNPKSGRMVDYAIHVEFGTSRMMPRPFMRPALDMCKRTVTKLIKEGLKK